MFIIDQFEHRKPDGSVDTDATHEEQVRRDGAAVSLLYQRERRNLTDRGFGS